MPHGGQTRAVQSRLTRVVIEEEQIDLAIGEIDGLRHRHLLARTVVEAPRGVRVEAHARLRARRARRSTGAGPG